jgi:hypothetical protein
MLLAVHVAANVQNHDGAKRPLLWTGLDHRSHQKVWAEWHPVCTAVAVDRHLRRRPGLSLLSPV